MLISKWEMFEMVMRRVKDAKRVVVDVETSGLVWHKNHIIGWVLTVGPGPDDTFYIPVRHAGGGNLPDPACGLPMTADGWDGRIHAGERAILEVLIDKVLVFHHGAFDLKFMHRIGYDSRKNKVEDTMVAAYITDELRFSLSLDACCKDEKVQAKLGSDLYKHIASVTGCAADKSAMGHLWRTSAEEQAVWEYGDGDGTSTYQLYEVLSKQINEPYYENATRSFDLKTVANVEYGLIPVLHRMSMRGVKVDEERLSGLIGEINREFEQAQEATGGINVRAPTQVKEYFIKAGVTDWPHTEKGAPSFAGDWLETTEAGRNIIKVRKFRTLLDSFLLPMKDYMVNGRVHADFHQTRDEEFGTRTGRLSITNPNLGAMPGKRQGELGKRFRSVFIPDKGKEFTEGDFAACEIRICAHYCKAPTWVKGFYNGLDPHTAVANDVGIDRKNAKTINLALMTGSGKSAIAKKLGLSESEGSALVDRYFRGLPELKKFQNDAKNVFSSRGFITTLLGRRLHLADRTKGYTALNRLTQGGNADVCKAAMIAMDKVEGADLLLTVYDSALVQHDIGDDGAKKRSMEAMVDMKAMGVPIEVPMEVECGTGSNWGEATFAKDQRKVTWFPDERA
jgi:DNA polymerase-1